MHNVLILIFYLKINVFKIFKKFYKLTRKGLINDIKFFLKTNDYQNNY